MDERTAQGWVGEYITYVVGDLSSYIAMYTTSKYETFLDIGIFRSSAHKPFLVLSGAGRPGNTPETRVQV